MKNQFIKPWQHVFAKAMLLAYVVLTYNILSINPLLAQDGNAGISEATNQVKSYFEGGTNLMYAVGAIVGLVGAVKVYKKFSDGEHDTGKVASSWFGACIFLVVVSTILKSFFGV